MNKRTLETMFMKNFQLYEKNRFQAIQFFLSIPKYFFSFNSIPVANFSKNLKFPCSMALFQQSVDHASIY